MKRAKWIGILLLLAAGHGAVAQSRALDSLRERLPHAKGQERYGTLIELFKENLGINYDSALRYASMAVDQARQNGDSLAMVKAYNAQGWVRMKLGSSLCIPDFEYALGIARGNGYQDQVKYLLNNLAIAHGDFANYDKALDYHFQSLQLRQLEGNALDISISLNNIGLVYSNLLDYENALSYFQQSKDIKEENGITHDLDRAYINIALAYYNLKNYDEATKNVSKVLELCEAGCEDEILVEAHYALAKILQKKGKLSERKKKLTKQFKSLEGWVPRCMNPRRSPCVRQFS